MVLLHLLNILLSRDYHSSIAFARFLLSKDYRSSTNFA